MKLYLIIEMNLIKKVLPGYHLVTNWPFLIAMTEKDILIM